MSKIINGVASEYDFPFKDFDVRYDEESIQKFNRWQDPTIEEYKKEISRLNNIIKDIKDYVNFLVIINQTINGKFSETQWDKIY